MKDIIRPRAQDDIPGNFAGIWVEQYAHDAAFRFLKAVEASIERPIRILVVDVVRVQELPCEGINVVISHQRRIAANRGHVTSFG